MSSSTEHFSRNFLRVLIGLLVVSLFWNLGLPGLFNEEPRRALIALEMMYNDNLIVPTQMGELYYKKPPVFNWLLMGSFKLFGVNEFAARLVTVSSLLFWALSIYLILKQCFERRIAAYTALFFMLCGDLLFAFSMLAEIDIFYGMISFWVMVLPIHFMRQSKPWLAWLMLFGLSGIGVLTKGVPSLAFLGMTTIGLLVGGTIQWKAFFRPAFWVSSIVFLCIVVGYYWAYSQHAPLIDFVKGISSQTEDRTLLKLGIAKYLKYLMHLPLMILETTAPLALFIPLLFLKQVKESWAKYSFLKPYLWVTLLNFLPYFLSPGTKSRYIYMFFPFIVLALMVAYENAPQKWKETYKTIMKWLTLSASGILVITLAATPFIPQLSTVTSIQWTTPLFLVILVTLAVYFRKSKVDWLLGLAAVLILARLAFDLVVLPVRAQTGELTANKVHASAMMEIVKDAPLHILNYQDDGSISLGMVFYIESTNKRTIRMKQPIECGSFYWGKDFEFDLNQFSVDYSYEWRNSTYYLAHLSNCDLP